MSPTTSEIKELMLRIWRATLGPVYWLLLGRRFARLEGGQRQISAELHNHIHGINVRQGDVNREVIERLAAIDVRLAALERYTHGVVAANRDRDAVARRLARIEDELAVREETASEPEPAPDSQPAADGPAGPPAVG